MSIVKSIAKMFEDKRRWRRYKARTKALPAGYRTAADGLERYLMVLGPGDGDSLLAMLEDLADLLEQSAADGTPLRSVVGEDPVEFAEAFRSNYPGNQWPAKERERLVEAIDRAVDES
jgi:DNA-binding ferritin-like protein (Dps family)